MLIKKRKAGQKPFWADWGLNSTNYIRIVEVCADFLISCSN